MHVLVTDDERSVRSAVRRALTLEGYRVTEAEDGAQALQAIARDHPDAIVLDVMMPELDGYEVCRALRDRGDSTPILMLTARDEVDQRVKGLDSGADDYLVKPFSPRELAARVAAVLRRASLGRRTAVDSFGDGRLLLDGDAREVTVDGRSVPLTRCEFDLLAALARHPGRVLSRYELITRVQGYDHDGYERTIDAHVKNLRRKLGEDPRAPRFVETVTGVGYKLTASRDA